MTSDGIKRGPGRPRKDVAPETATVRRRRRNARFEGGNKRLGMDESILDHSKFKYRIVNDLNSGRIARFNTHDDYDFVRKNGVPVAEHDSDLGDDVVSWVVGTKADGSPLRAYLMAKPREWYEADQAEKNAVLDEQLQQLKRGNDRDGESQSDYIPSGGIQIG